MSTAIKWGDFTATASDYGQRPPHSPILLGVLAAKVQAAFESPRVVDLCAGTGNLTVTLQKLGLSGWAIEPEAAMRAEAKRLRRGGDAFEWLGGSAEDTRLPEGGACWVVIGNAFQFLDPHRAIGECHRILRPGGLLTVLWNPRDLAQDEFQRRVDELVRASSPRILQTFTNAEKAIQPLNSSELFEPYLYLERTDWHAMSLETFMATWRSAHYVPSQVGPAIWQDILQKIEAMARRASPIRTAWRTRAWTYRAMKQATLS